MNELISFIINIETFLRNIFNSIPLDKKEHFILGVLFTSFVLIVINLTINKYKYISIILLILFSIFIEFFQKYTNTGNFEFYDMLATFLGGLIVISIGY